MQTKCVVAVKHNIPRRQASRLAPANLRKAKIKYYTRSAPGAHAQEVAPLALHQEPVEVDIPGDVANHENSVHDCLHSVIA